MYKKLRRACYHGYSDVELEVGVGGKDQDLTLVIYL